MAHVMQSMTHAQPPLVVSKVARMCTISQMMLVLSVSAGLVGSGAARAEPLRHTLVRQGSPKTKTGGHHVRSKTPNRGLSPPTEGGKSPRAPTSGERDNCLSSIRSLYVTSFMTYTFCVEFH